MMDWFNEEEFEDLSDAFVDDLLNPIDFSLLDIDVDDDDDDIDTTNGEVEDWGAKLKHLEPPPMDAFTSFPSEFKLGRVGTVKQSAAASVPDTKVSKMFQSLSPSSVLESSVTSFSPPNSRTQRLTSPVKGMRSKRKRPTTLRFKYLHQFEASKPEKLPPSESGTKTYYDFEQHAKKKRKISDGIARKCSHCETTETPQWREGPNGPKTLCNACGVRFRSGRLVPEYRPASSPTFIPFVHSNSHKKIIEMKRKESGQFHTSMYHGVISRA